MCVRAAVLAGQGVAHDFVKSHQVTSHRVVQINISIINETKSMQLVPECNQPKCILSDVCAVKAVNAVRAQDPLLEHWRFRVEDFNFLCSPNGRGVRAA